MLISLQLNMTTINFVCDPELDAELRKRARRKGDLSRIINDALRAYFISERE